MREKEEKEVKQSEETSYRSGRSSLSFSWNNVLCVIEKSCLFRSVSTNGLLSILIDRHRTSTIGPTVLGKRFGQVLPFYNSTVYGEQSLVKTILAYWSISRQATRSKSRFGCAKIVRAWRVCFFRGFFVVVVCLLLLLLFWGAVCTAAYFPKPRFRSRVPCVCVLQLYCPTGIPPMGNSGGFPPGKASRVRVGLPNLLDGLVLP